MELGFRLVVKLSKYFTDERSSCYVYVNNNIKSISSLESYLCDLFHLEGYFCLLKDGILLPSCENIHVLQANEVVSVIPLIEPFNYNYKSSRPVEETVETIEKDSKKKKRKKNKELNTTDVSNVDIIDAEEKSMNKENVDSPVKIATKQKVLENNEVFTAIKNIEEYHSKLFPQDDEDELESMKTKALNTLKEHFPVNINGVSEGRIKKRKRIRIRKSKKNNQIEMLHSDSESGKGSSSYLLSNGKKSSHIRFNPPEKPVNILQNENIVEKIDSAPRIIRAIQASSVPTNVNQNGKSPSISDTNDINNRKPAPNNIAPELKTNGVVNNTDDNTLKIMTKNIDMYPQIQFADVRENNVILFKMLKMNEDYTPVISDHILAKVLKRDSQSPAIKLLILEGQKELSLPSGKFDIDESEENAQDNTVDVSWDQLIDPRISLSI